MSFEVQKTLDKMGPPAEFPETPLRLEDIEGLDPEQCLQLIERRHHLLGSTLFTHIPSKGEAIWDSSYLPKLALLRLEGTMTKVCADFFAHELSLLNRKEVLLSPLSLRVSAWKYFSDVLKKRIRSYEQHKFKKEWSSVETLVTALEQKTGLNRQSLFSESALNRKRPREREFSLNEILTAFSRRIDNEPLESILSSFNQIPDNRMRDRLTKGIAVTFSLAARRLLPRNVRKNESG